MYFYGYRLICCIISLTLSLVLLSSSRVTFAQTQLPSRVAPHYGFIGSYNASAPFTLLGNEGFKRN